MTSGVHRIGDPNIFSDTLKNNYETASYRCHVMSTFRLWVVSDTHSVQNQNWSTRPRKVSTMITDFEWQECYSIGNAIIDQQHKTMLRLCSEASKCLESSGPESREMFHDLLHEMSVCAREHFATEEIMLHARHYPMLAEHRAEHDRYLVRLVIFQMSAMEGKLDKAGGFRFLTEWWGGHILESDMNCRSYLAENCSSGLDAPEQPVLQENSK